MSSGSLPARAEIVVVGSGAGGGTIAYCLAKAGAQVLLVESGDYLRTGELGSNEPVGRYLREIHPDRNVPLSYVGGQTKFYGAALYRLREADFRSREHESGRSPDWPFGYNVLEPYYEQAEALYRVHGAADVTDSPRKHELPFPPVERSALINKVVGRLNASGTRVASIPLGLDWRGGEGRCRVCATCDAHHCRIDAKMDTEIAAIRPALATGNLTLATLTTCLQVLTTPDGRRVRGVLLERGGEQTEVLASTVIVAAGFPRSAELLRRSRNTAHPEGLGNQGGALGRYVGGHSAGLLFSLVSLRKLPPVSTKSFSITDFYDRSPDWPFPMGVIQTVGQMPFWSEVPQFARGAARFIAERTLTSCYMTEALPGPHTGFRFDGDKLAGWVDPIVNTQTFRRLRRLSVSLFRKAGYQTLAPPMGPQLWHQVGTVRMGADPANACVDPNLQVHGVSGLHVADATVLPSAGAFNTSLTIIAMAFRCADFLGGRYRAGR